MVGGRRVKCGGVSESESKKEEGKEKDNTWRGSRVYQDNKKYGRHTGGTHGKREPNENKSEGEGDRKNVRYIDIDNKGYTEEERER